MKTAIFNALAPLLSYGKENLFETKNLKKKKTYYDPARWGWLNEAVPQPCLCELMVLIL